MGWNLEFCHKKVHEATGYTFFELTFDHKANLLFSISNIFVLTKKDKINQWQRKHNFNLNKVKITLIKINKKTNKFKIAESYLRAQIRRSNTIRKLSQRKLSLFSIVRNAMKL